MGFDKFLTKVFGSSNQRYLKSVQPIVEQINELEPAIKNLTDEQLRARTAEFKEQLQQAVAGVTDMGERKRREREALDEILPDCAEAHLWFERLFARNRALGFDAHDYLYQSWAYEAHDVGTTAGFADTAGALASINAKALLLAPPLDLFNPAQSARDAAAGSRRPPA